MILIILLKQPAMLIYFHHGHVSDRTTQRYQKKFEISKYYKMNTC